MGEGKGDQVNHFVIEQKLPSLNEVIGSNRANRMMAAKQKREIQSDILTYIRLACLNGDLVPQRKRCTISITWHERTKKRDVDNIQSAQKFILDAMVEGGILEDDSRKYVAQIYHHIVDDDRDYVEVYINDCT